MNQDMVLLLRKAIDREKASYELYISLLKKAPNPNVSALFNTLAIEELKHEALLNECLRGGDLSLAREKIYARHDEATITDKFKPTTDTAGLREGFEDAGVLRS